MIMLNELYEKTEPKNKTNKKKAKEENNKVLRKISKLLLNTLYYMEEWAGEMNFLKLKL